MANKETKPLVSVVFPNWNGKEDVGTYLSSLEKSSIAYPEIEVIMVDNGSNDGSVKFVKEKFPWVKIVSLSTNRGASIARNIGIKKSSGDFVLCSDNDVIFEKDTIAKMVEVFKVYKDAGVVGGKVFKKKPKSEIESAGGYGFNKWFGTIYDFPDSKKIKECEFVIGCAMLVKRLVFKKVGYFDETYLKYFEDGDLCFRAREAGFKVCYQPKAKIWHGKSKKTSALDLNQKFLTWYKNLFHFILKHSSTSQIITSFFSHLTFLPVIRYPYLYKRQEMPSFFYDYFLRYQAFFWNILNLGETWQKRTSME